MGLMRMRRSVSESYFSLAARQLLSFAKNVLAFRTPIIAQLNIVAELYL